MKLQADSSGVFGRFDQIQPSVFDFQVWVNRTIHGRWGLTRDVELRGHSQRHQERCDGGQQREPPSADWRRFGRLPGFTNCKPKYRKDNGLYPYVLLRSATGAPYRQAHYLRLEMMKLYQLQEQEREIRAAQYSANSIATAGRPPHSWLSLERFRNASKFHDRPAAADIAFCVAAISLRMPDDAIAAALDTNYLSSDPTPSRRAAYIRRTMTKARSWAKR